MLKEELVVGLDSHLRKRATLLSRNPIFEDYYGRAGSPVKADGASSTLFGGEEPTKSGRPKRTTRLIKDEAESLYVTPGLVSRTWQSLTPNTKSGVRT